jgi:hypothetical protein
VTAAREVVVAKELNQARLREFALVGALARLEELRKEEAQLRAQFPELFRGRAAPARKAAKRTRKPMSAAQRKAVSERMRKYWADQRKKKATQK